MPLILNFANAFLLTDKNGDLRRHKYIGPFASAGDARRWLMRYRAVLDAANAGDVSIDILDAPNAL